MLNISIGEHQISQPGISGLTLTVISFLLFLAGLMFSIRFAKTKEEAGLKKQYDIANQEGKKASKQIQKNLKTIDQIQSDCNIKTEEALRRYEYAVATEQKLMSIGKKAVGLFITTNLRYRTDHITPEFFANQPKLEYTTFFDNLKKNEQ